MPLPLLLPLITTGLSAIGGLFGKKQQQTTTSTIDPAYKNLQSMVLNTVQRRLAGGGPDLSGYAANGASTINRGYQLAGQNLDNTLTARGLATSPAAVPALTKLQTSRAGDVASFNNSLPLLLDQLRRQDLFSANNVLSGAPRSVASSGSSGGGPGGMFENLAAMLGYLQGQGAFGQHGGNGLPGYQWPPV